MTKMMDLAEACALNWAREQSPARRFQIDNDFHGIAPKGWQIGKTADRLLPQGEPREPWVKRAIERGT